MGIDWQTSCIRKPNIEQVAAGNVRWRGHPLRFDVGSKNEMDEVRVSGVFLAHRHGDPIAAYSGRIHSHRRTMDLRTCDRMVFMDTFRKESIVYLLG